MTGDLHLRRKWTLRAGDRRIVLVKRSNEKASHVVMKGLLWAMFLPSYPEAMVELAVADRYAPDVVSLDAYGRPVFWGEAGQVSVEKLTALAKRYRDTHIAVAKWGGKVDFLGAQYSEAIAGVERTAPFELYIFPEDSASRFIDADGVISIDRDAVPRYQILPAERRR